MKKKLNKSLSLDEIFAFINVLKIISKTLKFRSWLKTYHKIKNDEEFFEGYKFFLITSLRSFITSIINDSTLELEEDYTFFRAAHFANLLLEDVPNTCEKAIFIKNIWNLSRGMRKSRNWVELQSNLKNLKKIFTKFDKLYGGAVSVRASLNKKEALKIATEFSTTMNLSDIGNSGYPYGYFSPLLKHSITEDYLKRSMKGYLYSLEYVWLKLIGYKKFKKSCVKDLHSIPDWRELHTFYSKIREEIIWPMEKNLKLDLATTPLLAIKKMDKSIIKDLLSTKNTKVPNYFGVAKKAIEDPRHLSKKDKELIKKWLDYHLLWYDINVLDTHGLDVFNGIPAFISTLIGLVELNKYYNKGRGKVLIRIFKHPVRDIKGFDYSYALCIPVFGYFLDASGWLVFFNCATDYSGTGDSMRRRADIFIEKYKKDNLVEVEEVEVNKDIFKEYLAQKNILISNETIRLEIFEIQKEVTDFKGKFFEYVFYKWLSESERCKKYDEIKCDLQLNGEQIDCIGKKDDKIDVFDCKINLHNIDEAIKQVKRKANIVKKEFGQGITDVKPRIVVYFPLEDFKKSIQEKSEKHGVIIEDNFREEILKNRIFEGSRKIIQRFLEYEPNY
jgi:hypothetical protein